MRRGRGVMLLFTEDSTEQLQEKRTTLNVINKLHETESFRRNIPLLRIQKVYSRINKCPLADLSLICRSESTPRFLFLKYTLQ